MRERRPWAVGLIAIVVIAAGLAGAFSIERFPALRGVYTVYADLQDAAGLRPGNEVRVAGVKVGQVKGVVLRPNAARVQMEIEKDVRLPVETRVEVKLKTLLGQKFVDLEMPRDFLSAASNGQGAAGATEGFLEDGEVIPRSQTSIPFEIYQAANEGTAVLEKIDKAALRELLDVLGGTLGTSKKELRRALVSLHEVTDVLDDRGPQISALLRHSQQLTGTLATSDEDIEGILVHGASVLKTLAERRATISSLLQATDDLSANLALLIGSVRGDVALSVTDLNSILALVDEEMDSLDAALAEIGIAQEMFGTALQFGRFTEGTVCAVISADTCDPEGSPEDPGLPVHGRQPENPAVHGRVMP